MDGFGALEWRSLIENFSVFVPSYIANADNPVLDAQ